MRTYSKTLIITSQHQNANMTGKEIANGIKNVMAAFVKPVNTIPPLLLLCEIVNRPGLSAISLASSIIQRLQNLGIPTGPNPDGSENLICQSVYAMSQSIVDEIHDHGVVELPLQPGSISITGIGGNAGGPVTVTGYNNMPTTLRAVMR